MPKFSIVIPAYNESERILTSLTQVFTFMRNYVESFEVVVVDDGSKDNTVELLEKYAQENSELVIVRNPHKGKGPTVYTGMTKAKGQYILMTDADMATPIDELKKFYNWIEEHNYDIVIASREGIGARRVNEPFYRHLMGRVFNIIVQIIALPGINDSQCGFKLFKASVARDIFSRLKIYGDDSKEIKKGYMGAFDVEVLFIARKLKYKIKEISVPWTYVKTTRLNVLSDSINMALDVLKVRLNDLKGVYKVNSN